MAKPHDGHGGALFSIGQMAKLFNMNIRTLRYYDQIGLLVPEYVDPQSNYRYYSSAQFERLNTIKYLRALDVPIERISTFFEGRDVSLICDIFETQLEAVAAKQRELKRIERKIRARLAQIDEAVNGAFEEVEVRQLPKRRVVRLAETFGPDADLEPLIRDLGNIVNYFSQLDELNTEDVEPTYQCFDMQNVWREDVIEEFEANREDLLNLTVESEDHQIKVPKVL